MLIAVWFRYVYMSIGLLANWQISTLFKICT
jgi:uncharacterized membrane protein YuzA (DUF378 family)